MGVRRHQVDDDAAPLRLLQQRQVVGRIFRGVRDDAVAGLERQAVEGHVPGARRILDEGDLLRLCVQKPGELVIEDAQFVAEQPLRLIAADAVLELQGIGDGLEHRQRHQRGSGIVEMQDIGA